MADADTCLRLPLVPLEVGHLRLLREVDSPFLEGTDATIQDTLVTAAICALPSKDALALTRWYYRPVLWLWSLACRKCVWILEAAKLRRHINAALDVQNIKRVGKSKVTITSPLDQRLYQMLRAELHCDHGEALSYPVRDAMDLWVSLAEQRGAIELWSDEEIEVLKWHKEQEEKMRKEANN